MSKRRFIPLLTIFLVLVMASGTWMSASAKGAEVPFHGYYVTYPKIVGVDQNGCNIQEIDAVGQATHLGESTWHSDALACRSTWKQSGSITFTADNGDLLNMMFDGTFTVIISSTGPTAVFQGSYTITGGNGRFYEMGGSGAYWGSSSLLPGGTGEIYFDGTLEKP